MSRSYRKPATAVTTCSSAKDDKKHAHRGVRRAQNQALKTCLDWDEFLIPHKYECSWNETYNWGRDGCQKLYFLSDFQSTYIWRDVIMNLYDDPIEEFEKLKRK